MENKIFCGNAKELTTKEGVVFAMSIDLDMDEIESNTGYIKEWSDKNGVRHRTLKIKATKLKEPTQYKTHYVEIDQWKPTGQQQTATTPVSSQTPTPPVEKDDLPFILTIPIALGLIISLL